MSEQLDWIEQLEAAHPVWLARMKNAIEHVARGKEEFTSDEIWTFMEDQYVLPENLERRTLGAAIRRAADNGLIEPTGRYRASLRPENHHRPVCVWQRVDR